MHLPSSILISFFALGLLGCQAVAPLFGISAIEKPQEVATVSAQATIFSAPSGSINTTSATVTFSITPNAAKAKCMINSLERNPCVSPLNLTGIPEGGKLSGTFPGEHR